MKIITKRIRLSRSAPIAFFTLFFAPLLFSGCANDLTEQQANANPPEAQPADNGQSQSAETNKTPTKNDTSSKAENHSLKKIVKTEAQWREQLTDEQFLVARQEGTERAFTGKYWDNKKDGVYNCVCCGLPLFDSKTKYESGTGWPSFWKPLNEKHVGEKRDVSLFSVRTEVHCARCDGHLGHVFTDGPPETTGLRYCLNSAALDFEPRKEKD